MFFRIKSYIHFLLKSTNQHGVHSPFVYSLVTKCFYDRKKKSSYPEIKTLYKKQEDNPSCISFKTFKLLNRLIPYLGYQKILVPDNIDPTIVKVLSASNSLAIYDQPITNETYDFIFTDLNTQTIEVISQLLTYASNDSLLIINNIHQTPSNQGSWEKIKKNSKVKVTIDTYKLGFVFFRKEQAQEHFTIRL